MPLFWLSNFFFLHSLQKCPGFLQYEHLHPFLLKACWVWPVSLFYCCGHGFLPRWKRPFIKRAPPSPAYEVEGFVNFLVISCWYMAEMTIVTVKFGLPCWDVMDADQVAGKDARRITAACSSETVVPIVASLERFTLNCVIWCSTMSVSLIFSW